MDRTSPGIAKLLQLLLSAVVTWFPRSILQSLYVLNLVTRRPNNQFHALVITIMSRRCLTR